jgi:hypothetical protein
LTLKEDAVTDEQQVRSLLTLAAELPDDVQAPVDSLLRRARRKRRVRAASSVLAVVVLTASALALPPIIHSLSGGSPRPTGVGGHGKRGPTATQLTHFRWSSLPPSPLGPRSMPLVASTGKELIELGGISRNMTQVDGAAFVPATGRWHRIAAAPYNVGFTDGWTGRNFSNVVDAWTGHQLFVTNGDFESCAAGSSGSPAMCYPHAGLYDPATNTWSSTKLPKQMYGLDLQSAVWTGGDVVIAGTSCCPTLSPNKATPAAHARLAVAAYNPATNRWHMITPRLPAGHPPRYVEMVATPGRLLLWSLWDVVTMHKHGLSDRVGVDVLSLASDGSWHVVTGDWPQNQNLTAPIFVRNEILLSPATIWCGQRCGLPITSIPGYFVNAATLVRKAIPLGPLGQPTPAFVWTGRAIIAVNINALSGPGTHNHPDDMAVYDPAAHRWANLPAPPGRPPMAAAPIWAGNQLLLLTESGRLLSFHA